MSESQKKYREPMPRSQRAKQFAPFDALTGLHTRLSRAIEEHREERESDGIIHVEIDSDSEI